MHLCLSIFCPQAVIAGYYYHSLSSYLTWGAVKEWHCFELEVIAAVKGKKARATKKDKRYLSIKTETQRDNNKGRRSGYWNWKTEKENKDGWDKEEQIKKGKTGCLKCALDRTVSLLEILSSKSSGFMSENERWTHPKSLHWTSFSSVVQTVIWGRVRERVSEIDEWKLQSDDPRT